MSANEQADKLAALTSEAILQLIYGDDLTGCSVSPEAVATLVSEAFRQRERQNTELLHLYSKVVEAVQVLSTPPDAGKIASPAELHDVLSDRLDKIHTIAKKTIETTASFKT